MKAYTGPSELFNFVYVHISTFRQKKNRFKINIAKDHFELKRRSYCSSKVRPCLWNVILHPIEITFTKQYGNVIIRKIHYLHQNFLLHFFLLNTSDIKSAYSVSELKKIKQRTIKALRRVLTTQHCHWHS